MPLAASKGIAYFIAPEHPVARFAMSGMFGRYEIVILLQDDGRFLQFRTVDYLHCPADHAHLGPVLQTLATINFTKRLVRYAWNSSDGEIVVSADAWVMDNQVTQEQFNRMLNNFFAVLDVGHRGIKTTLETGSDPGEQDPQTLLAKATGGTGPTTPPRLKAHPDKPQEKDGDKPSGEGVTESKPEITEI